MSPQSWASLVAQLVKNLPAMQETWVRSLGWEDSLEKGKATHSSILAWRIPPTVQSMGSQKVGHDWVTFTHSLLKAVVVSLSEVSCCLALPVYDPIHLLVPISCYQSQNLPSLLKSPVLLRAGVLSRFSHVWLFGTLWTIAHQASLTKGFCRQEYSSGLSCPPPVVFPVQELNLSFLCLLSWQVGSLSPVPPPVLLPTAISPILQNS